MKVNKILNLFLVFFLIIILFCNTETLPMLISCSLIALVFIIIRKYNLENKTFILIIIITTIVTQIICIIIFQNEQISDFKTLLDISKDLLDGNLNNISQNYINTWPYQTPFILYQTMLLKICNNEIFLKVCNTLLNIFISLLIYSIGKKISNQKSSQVITILYMLFINKILYNNILTNQIPYMFFLLLGLNIFFSEKIKSKKHKILLFSLCTSIANLFRPEGIIILLSFICYEFYKCIKDKKFINFIISITIFIIIYLLVNNGIMLILKRTIIKEPQDIGVLYKVVMGLNIDTNGRWSSDEFNSFFSFNNQNDLLQYEINKIKERITDIRIFKLFISKVNAFWNDFDMVWTLGYLNNSGLQLGSIDLSYSTLYTFIYNYDIIIWITIIILAIIGIKEYHENSVLLNIIVIANFLIYLIIEIQGRYSVFCRILIFILASKGLKKILNLKISRETEINSEREDDFINYD